MTAHDFDGPRMIYTGELPRHLRAGAPSADADEVFDASEGGARGGQAAAVLGAAAIALIAGIGIGAVIASRMESRAPAAAIPTVATRRTAPIAPPGPAVAATAVADATAAPPQANTRTAEAPPPPASILENRLGSAPRAALAMLLPASKVGQVAVVEPRAARPCAGRSRAETTVCSDPVVAAADRDLKTAYQDALIAGAPPEAVRADQIDWLLAREEAARRSPAELALAYRQRIDRVNSLAAESPH